MRGSEERTAWFAPSWMDSVKSAAPFVAELAPASKVLAVLSPSMLCILFDGDKRMCLIDMGTIRCDCCEP